MLCTEKLEIHIPFVSFHNRMQKQLGQYLQKHKRKNVHNFPPKKKLNFFHQSHFFMLEMNQKPNLMHTIGKFNHFSTK